MPTEHVSLDLVASIIHQNDRTLLQNICVAILDEIRTCITSSTPVFYLTTNSFCFFPKFLFYSIFHWLHERYGEFLRFA